jgi:tryptophan halogenase
MKIVIVGGGTAGWLAAVMIKKTQSQHEIIVVESTKLGIIGAGEASTGEMVEIVQGGFWDFGLNEKDFILKTNATIKLGIRHKDWKQLGHEYIAPIDNPVITKQRFGTTTSFLHAIANDIPMHLSSYNGYQISQNSSSFFDYEGNIANGRVHAYHFDGVLVGKYLKESLGNDVKHIDSIVKNVNLNSDGYIQDIVLEDGSILNGDFFIDCTGFSRIFAKALKVEWKSYDKYLPVNTALPFFLERKENEKIEPLMTSWAQKNGWMWKVPLQHRYGCGYVFDNRFTSIDNAKLEIESVLGHEINPIKIINFETGKLKNVWEKNCLFIGLSSSFLEPMEATSIHGSVLQLNSFIFDYLRDDMETTCNQGSINNYNKTFGMLYDSLVDFISLHYASSRTDSEFWKNISHIDKRTDGAKNLLLTLKDRIPNDADFIPFNGYAGASLHNWILGGLGYIDKERAIKELEFFDQVQFAKEEFEEHIRFQEKMKPIFINNNDLIRKLKN